MTFDRLQEVARKHVEHIDGNKPSPACLSDEVIQASSSDISLKSLEQWLIPVEDKEDLFLHQQVLVAEVCLRNLKPKDANGLSENVMEFLRQWTIDAILPTALWAEKAPFSTAPKKDLRPKHVGRLKSLNIAGLHVLSHLETISPIPSWSLPVNLVTCLASFTDPSDPWSSHQIASIATSSLKLVLSALEPSPKASAALLTTLLSEQVKPLFAKSKNSAITPAGRKAINQLPSNFTHIENEERAYPWRYNDIYIVTVLQWILQKLNGASFQSQFPLLIPPILALLDCSSPPIKARGCAILSLFLHLCPPTFLHRTGLGSVFLDALLPSLHYLPTLTPESDSLMIIGATYPALMGLVRALYPGKAEKVAKLRELNKILRDGVFKGHALAGENVRIAEMLLRQMAGLVDEMGIECVKHLKHIFPLISNPLTSPFATSYPPLLSAALEGLQAVIVNAWPRISHHRGEILGGLAIVWVRILHDQDNRLDEDLKGVQAKAKEVARLALRVLSAGSGDDEDVTDDELRGLVEADGRLQTLFSI